MKGFHFRFAKVLEVKRRKEEALKSSLARLDEEISGKRRELGDLKRRVQHLQDELRDLYRERVVVEDVLFAQRALAFLREEIREREKSLESLLQERQEVSTALLQIMRERKTLEKLEEKERDNFRREVFRLAQKASDEMAGRVWRLRVIQGARVKGEL